MSQPPQPLSIPPLGSLTDDQVRGATCVHCGTPLAGVPAVDLGEQHARRAGDLVRWFPRTCIQDGPP